MFLLYLLTKLILSNSLVTNYWFYQANNIFIDAVKQVLPSTNSFDAFKPTKPFNTFNLSQLLRCLRTAMFFMVNPSHHCFYDAFKQTTLLGVLNKLVS
jgi:hypothetical protein